MQVKSKKKRTAFMTIMALYERFIINDLSLRWLSSISYLNKIWTLQIRHFLIVYFITNLYVCIKGSGTYPCTLLSKQFLIEVYKNTKRNTSA